MSSIKVTVGAATLAAAALLIPAGQAMAAPAAACANGHFCAYENDNYGGRLLLDSTAGPGGRADVANDLVSSLRNLTGNEWHAKNRRAGFPDATVFISGPHSNTPSVGARANDKIDHFDVKRP